MVKISKKSEGDPGKWEVTIKTYFNLFKYILRTMKAEIFRII